MRRLVAFDLDGTLVDTPRAIVETFTTAFTAMGCPAPPAQDIRLTIGLPLRTAFGKLLGVPTDDDRVPAGVRLYQALFREIALPQAARLVFPGVGDGLKSLSRNGFLLTVATSKFRANAVALLEAAGLLDHFRLVVGADQVTRPKPDRETGDLVLRECGAAASRAVMVGDTTHDLLMAKAAGMRSVAVTYGVHSAQELSACEPTWIADTFDEAVKSILDGFS